MRKNILGKMGIAVCISAVLITGGCAKKAENVPDTSTVKTETEAATETKTEDVVSEAKEADASDFTYDEEDGKIVLTSYKGTATDIVIPSQIDGKDVYAIGEHCFANDKIVSVVCPETLVEIRKEAFINCGELKNVELNDGLVNIKESAFLTTGIESIIIPDTVESMEKRVFGGGVLTDIKLSSNITQIPRGCFAGCNFESITIPSTVKSVGEQAFVGCKFLKEVVIEEGVEKIEDGAFKDCKEIESFIIPSTITEMIDFDPAYDNPKATITVTAGSYAEQYMKDNKIDYITK